MVDVIVPLQQRKRATGERGPRFHIGRVWFAADAAERGERASDLVRRKKA
jgi:hypothetical protein